MAFVPASMFLVLSARKRRSNMLISIHHIPDTPGAIQVIERRSWLIARLLCAAQVDSGQEQEHQDAEQNQDTEQFHDVFPNVGC